VSDEKEGGKRRERERERERESEREREREKGMCEEIDGEAALYNV